MKKVFAAISITILLFFAGFHMISTMTQARESGIEQEAGSTTDGAQQQTPTGEEQSTGEEASTEDFSGETSTDESTQESSSEESTAETTTEEPTTLDYEIIDGVYKVKENVLIAYLGNPKDKTVTTLKIPASVFQGCKYIKKVTFEAGSLLTTIGKYAFKGCTAMNSISLPTGLKSIGYRAFGSCTSLESLTIPATVTQGNMIFGTVSSVTTVKFAAETTTVPSKILREQPA